MIDKLLVNNQLLAEKNKVQRAKVNVINKLVNKIRLLKKNLEKYPENRKFKTKIERATEILTSIKKYNKIDLLRQSLAEIENPHKVLSSDKSTPDEIAVAIISQNKCMLEIVKRLREKLNLNESNPSWKDEILELSKRKKRKSKTERRKALRQEKKAYIALQRKRSIWLEENIDEEITSKRINAEERIDAKLSLGESKTSKTTASIKKATSIKKADQKQSKLVTPVRSSSIEDSDKKSMVIQENSEDKKDDAEKVVKTVDPFFVTLAGDNYFATAVIDRTQAEPLYDGLIRKQRRAILMGKHPKQTTNRNKNSKLTKHNNQNKDTFGKKKKVLIPKKDKNFFNGKDKESSVLHPSWIAKQKQKGILEFKGKKICFDGDDNKKHHTDKNLHPSWEAKKKQKSIPQFQGTKISFDDNLKKNNIAKEGVEVLHPSWAAKQKMKPIIAEFKGKKVLFDED